MLDEFQPVTFNTCFANSDQLEVMNVLHERPVSYFSGSAKMYGQNIQLYGISIHYEFTVRNTVI
jgi:hypothetical protein